MFRKFYSQEISGEYTHEMCEVGKRAPRITYLAIRRTLRDKMKALSRLSVLRCSGNVPSLWSMHTFAVFTSAGVSSP